MSLEFAFYVFAGKFWHTGPQDARLALEMDEAVEVQEKTGSAVKWTKRFGAAAFLFFLVKGLLWLIVPALIAYLSLT